MLAILNKFNCMPSFTDINLKVFQYELSKNMFYVFM